MMSKTLLSVTQGSHSQRPLRLVSCLREACVVAIEVTRLRAFGEHMPLQSQRSVSEVLQDIVANLEEIIRSEFRLATTEIKEEAARTFKPVATFGAGIDRKST